jgi:exodeoxyribonuclease VII large subunit
MMSTTASTGDGPDLLAENTPEFSVGEISNALKKTVEGAFAHVRVRGEISGLKKPPSGHLYFDLKDENAVINSVCWKGVARRLKYPPEEGLEVIVTGKITTYAPRSNYQLVVESIEPAGAGALMAMLEERRKKLAAEGLFDAERKQDIPYLPQVIGVVTSPTGAVIKDILHRLADRFPTHVVLWPVLVQGEKAAEQVAAAIRGFNGLDGQGDVPRPDLLIVARGGGSLEDLWAFNEEVVVRATAESVIPLISAVGHETDTTLIDFASDLRAPTPTAAAELAVPVLVDLVATVSDLDRRRHQAVVRSMEERRTQLRGLARGMPSLQDLLGLRQQRFDEMAERLPRALRANTQVHRQKLTDGAAGLRPSVLLNRLDQHRDRLELVQGRVSPAMTRRLENAGNQLEGLGRLLGSLGYHAVLSRGYAVVRDADDLPIMSSRGPKAGDALAIEFSDGRTHVSVTGVEATRETPAPKKKARASEKKTKPKSKPKEDQGDLF